MVVRYLRFERVGALSLHAVRHQHVIYVLETERVGNCMVDLSLMISTVREALIDRYGIQQLPL